MRLRTVLGLPLFLGSLAWAADLGLTGIAHVALRVADVAKSRDFYGRVLGFAEPFEFSDQGKTTVAFMKVNDRQYIELYPRAAGSDEPRLAHVCLETSDIQLTYQGMVRAGLKPTPVTKARAGNLLTTVRDGDGHLIEFLQYLPGSLHMNSEGKALPAGRIADRLARVWLAVSDLDRALHFYRDALGLEQIGAPSANSTVLLQIPGQRGDVLAIHAHPFKEGRRATDAMEHISLASADFATARRVLASRGVTPREGEPLAMFDPDATRVEISKPPQDLLPLAIVSYIHTASAQPGDRVDLASFGRIKGWPGGDQEIAYSRKDRLWRAVRETGASSSNLGIEWDEPREFTEIRVSFREPIPPDAVTAEYWVSSWPPPEGRGGWTLTDSPYNGKWTAIQAERSGEQEMLVFRFAPLSAEENPNARRAAGWSPRFRRAVKVRLRFTMETAPVITALQVYGRPRWNARDVIVETGLEKKPAEEVAVDAYNGTILSTDRDGSRMRIHMLYTEHPSESNDRTILQLSSSSVSFGVAIDDLIAQKGIYVRDAGIFIGDGALGETFESFLASGRMRLGRDIRSLVSKQPEQSLERATAEVPALGMTNRRPFRYIPLGFPGNREKYGLLFNGNVFIGKRDSKLFGEETARMLWNGDTITYRIATGAVPDFRERERSARQRLLEDELPIALTAWTTGGVEYREEAFATLLEPPLDPLKNRGDEHSVLLLRVTASNVGTAPQDGVLWLSVQPDEKLRLRDGVLEAIAGDGQARFRAALKASAGAFRTAPLPPESDYRGPAVLWEGRIAAAGSVSFEIRAPFMTPVDAAAKERIASMDYDLARTGVIAYWRDALNTGMRLHVPDEALNRFYRAALQHNLLSLYRDVPTGLFMAPCGTFRYNMFANETNMQARLMDMRGLHDWAARFVEPFVSLQGSKPFPGRFRETAAIFHGVRVDTAHDYTSSGYNLNHGWTLWTLSEHYLFARDRGWLNAKLPAMKKAADWIVSERNATMRTDEDNRRAWEFGLLPAGQLEDNEEWLYWYAVNGYAYRGLRAFARALADVDRSEADRYDAEAAKYRSDIRAATLRSMAAAPVARLMDGTSVPVMPSRTHLHGRDLGWIRNILYGALAMVDCGVFDPDEHVVEWILKDHEDNLFMAPLSFSVPESDWFSRGGITLQPNLVNTPVTYLLRDEIPQALRGFYNTFAASYYPDVNCFTEWSPSFGASGGPFYKTSDEAGFLTWLRLFLLREDGDTLKIAMGAPRRWFRTGQRIELEDAATFFGKVSYKIESHAADGSIDAEVRLPAGFRGKRVVLRVRHPEQKAIASVERNGVTWTQFDRGKETIDLPVEAGEQRVLVRYER